jgi:hypothetical protein
MGMKYGADTGSGAMAYIPSFIHQKLIAGGVTDSMKIA